MIINKPLEPTKEMLEAGIEELKEELSGLLIDVEELADHELSDVVCFIWQAMWAQG